MTGEGDREARRLLRRLVHGARLERDAQGAAVLVAADGRRRSAVEADIAVLLARGWLNEESGGFAVTAAGRDRFAREALPQDAFAAQHQVLNTRRIKDERGRDCYVVVNAAESPLALLYQRGLVTPLQFEAGEKLRRDFTLAQLTPRLGVDLSAPVGRRSRGSEFLVTETALAAKQRFNRAMRAAGSGLADLLFDVCCVLRGLEESERGRGWPRSSARIVLRIALDRLAHHYGMGAKRSCRIRAWSKDDEAAG